MVGWLSTHARRMFWNVGRQTCHACQMGSWSSENKNKKNAKNKESLESELDSELEWLPTDFARSGRMQDGGQRACTNINHSAAKGWQNSKH